MKATGIVRRIDDLGRVVIPKEIRRTMRIRDGDPLEIYTEKDGEVIFKKYSPMGELSEFADQMCESLFRAAERTAAICDRDGVIAAAGSGKRNLIDRSVTPELERIMEKRGTFSHSAGSSPVHAVSGDERFAVSVAVPILSEGDLMGCVMFLSESGETAGSVEMKLAQAAAGFLGRQMES